MYGHGLLQDLVRPVASEPDRYGPAMPLIEAQLSPFHFARMFKQSSGVPPRVYLTRLRLEKACELLEMTDRPVTEIAHDVGYSSNQVLARVFLKHRHMSPTDYRQAVRDPRRQVSVGAAGTTLAAAEDNR